MKYRILKLDEKPDYRKGDEPSPWGDRWCITTWRGKFTVKEIRRDNPKVKYRRPVDSKGRDLK